MMTMGKRAQGAAAAAHVFWRGIPDTNLGCRGRARDWRPLYSAGKVIESLLFEILCVFSLTKKLRMGWATGYISSRSLLPTLVPPAPWPGQGTPARCSERVWALRMEHDPSLGLLLTSCRNFVLILLPLSLLAWRAKQAPGCPCT